MNYQGLIIQAIVLFNEVAPSEASQEALRVMVQDMESENNSSKQILIAILSTILDGLKFGNWPGNSA